MSDRRFKNGIFQGNPMSQQQALNQQQETIYKNHPWSYGWNFIYNHPETGLPVYEKDQAKLSRHPEKDAWLIQWEQYPCYSSEAHISVISENLDQIKYDIEQQARLEKLVSAGVELVEV